MNSLDQVESLAEETDHTNVNEPYGEINTQFSCERKSGLSE